MRTCALKSGAARTVSRQQCFLILAMSLSAGKEAVAATVSGLTIEGTIVPGIVGSYSVDAAYSWISHRYPLSSDNS